MSFGQHLRGLREAAGLPRAELARQAGVPLSTLRNWEGDRGFPGVAAALRLAGALGVSVERLAEGVEDPAEDEGEPSTERGRGAKGRAAAGPVTSTPATEQQAVPPSGGREAEELPPAQQKPRMRRAQRPRGG